MAHCSACFHTKHSALAPHQLLATNATEPPDPPSYSFSLFPSLTFWLTPVSPLLHLSDSHSLLHSFGSLSSLFCLPSLSLSPPLPGLFSCLPVLQRGCGLGPGPPGFHSDALCPDVISIDGVQLGQAVLAQGLFTVYPKLRPFTHRRVCDDE